MFLNYIKTFLSFFSEYENVVSYQFFKYYFNIGFGFPRKDLCNECELFYTKIKSSILSNKSSEEISALKVNLQKHQMEAQNFYKIKKEIKKLVKLNDKICAISLDYEKNLPIPVTNVSSEYYMRQLWIQNFCIHTFKNETADMFVYSEHFAGKGPNEVISFIEFYVKKLNSNIKILYIFCDNAFSQNKNRFNWIYFSNLIKNEKLEEIVVIYPIPGHSYLNNDRNFGRIEKNRLKIEKISYPSEYVELIKEMDKKFVVNYANFPFTDDLQPDGSNIVIIKNFKKHFENILVNSVEHLTQIRKIKFNKEGVCATTDHLSENYEINVNLVKPNFVLEKFNFDNLEKAYNGFLPIKKPKLNDVKKLLEYVILPPNVNFYDSITCLEENIIHSKSKSRAYQLICKKNSSKCECKGKCIKLWECRKKSQNCNENCFCIQNICKNRA
jgi:hypothetical protein